MKKQYLLFLSIFLLIVILTIGYFGVFLPYKTFLYQEKDLQAIHQAWNEENYQKVLDLSNLHLEKFPDNSDVFLLIGFANFNLAYFNSNYVETVNINKIWNSIHAIRKALVLGINTKMEKMAYYILGKDYYILSQNYLNQAIVYLQKAIQLGQNSNDTYEFLAQALLKIGRVSESIDLLVSRISVMPILTNYLLLVDIYLDQNENAKARSLIEEAKKLGHSSQEIIALKIRESRALIAEDKLDNAKNELYDIIQVYPQSVEAHYYLGNVFEKLGDMSKARFEWRKAYKMSPNWDKIIAKLDQEVTQ